MWYSTLVPLIIFRSLFEKSQRLNRSYNGAGLIACATSFWIDQANKRPLVFLICIFTFPQCNINTAFFKTHFKLHHQKLFWHLSYMSVDMLRCCALMETYGGIFMTTNKKECAENWRKFISIAKLPQQRVALAYN